MGLNTVIRNGGVAPSSPPLPPRGEGSHSPPPSGEGLGEREQPSNNHTAIHPAEYPSEHLPRPLLIATTLLAFIVVGLGAYVRLSDAGLGCPDWPGCYGQLTPHHAADAIAAAQAQWPDGPVSPAKAWKEMLHRYLASLLGLAILAIAWLAWRRGLDRRPAMALLGLVLVQGLLGMWTVTLTLQPAIVSAHLLGGMATLAMLVWLAVRQPVIETISSFPRRRESSSKRLGSRLRGNDDTDRNSLTVPIALAAVFFQIALGGWVSSHYAALACADFPTCGGAWWPDADWLAAFRIDGDPGHGALVAMHWAHRLGALVVTLAVAALAWRLLHQPALQRTAWLLLALLAGQLALGMANVLAGLPLAVAVAHNLGAALLLASLVWLYAKSRRST